MTPALLLRAVAVAGAFVLGTSSHTTSGPADAASPRLRSYVVSGGAHPHVTKVLVVIEENHSLAEAQRSMPYLASLAHRYAYATHYRAITHPSLPNYLAIAGGSTFGVTDDADPSVHPILGTSVFGQAIAHGGTAQLFADAAPGACATVSAGRFAVRHTPWAYFADERADCRRGDLQLGSILSREAAAGRLPTVSMVIPDLDHDAHDGTLATADSWLKRTLAPVLAGPDFTTGRLAVIVTSDEDDHTQSNTVLTVVAQTSLKGVTVSTPLDHFSLSGFISHVIGVSPLRRAAGASSFARAFGFA